MSVLDLASMCVIHPTFISCAAHCFRVYHSACLEFDNLTVADQQKCRSFVMLMKYFGASASKVIIFNTNKSMSLSGATVLKVMAKYCSDRLKTVVFIGLHVNLTNCKSHSKYRMLGLARTISEWKFFSSSIVNCGPLFEYGVDVIERVTVHNTSMDRATRDHFVQHYPHLKSISLDNLCFSHGSQAHMYMTSIRHLMTLNADVDDFKLAHSKINGKQNVFDGQPIKSLEMHLPGHKAQQCVTLGRMENLESMAIVVKEIHCAWFVQPMALGLKELPKLSTLRVKSQYPLFPCFILCMLIEMPNLRELIVEIENLSFWPRSIVADGVHKLVRINLTECRRIANDSLPALSEDDVYKIVYDIFAGPNAHNIVQRCNE